MAFIGNTPQNQGFAPAVDYFSGNGVTVTFTLSRPVASVAQMIVAVDNVIQNPSSSFTVSGSSITFTSAPLSGTNNIWVEYTSLITTYAALSQSPSVIGDITASGGYLASGAFGNSYLDGTIVDYVTGNGRVTVGPADGLTIYNGGTSARSALLALNANGAMGVGTSPSYGTAGQVLTSSGTGSAPTWAALPLYSVSYLAVAGGGGASEGGGGAGGYLTGSSIVISGNAYAITIGAGGTAAANNTSGGTNGGNTLFGTLATAIGGGYGGYAASAPGNSGGSGGGGRRDGGSAGGYGTACQGNAGGTSAAGDYRGGAGGGGAGAAGSGGGGGTATSEYGGAGGVGTASSISGTSTYYAGGGGGGTEYGARSGRAAGGNGGGGFGCEGNAQPATSGTANTGGGGGGVGGGSGNPGSGGSGIVIISYPGSQRGTGGTITSSGGNTIHTFTTSGTFTA